MSSFQVFFERKRTRKKDTEKGSSGARSRQPQKILSEKGIDSLALIKMKLNPNVSSSRRKSRKAHFASTSVERRVRMSSALSKELFQRYHVSKLIYNN